VFVFSSATESVAVNFNTPSLGAGIFICRDYAEGATRGDVTAGIFFLFPRYALSFLLSGISPRSGVSAFS
jgi:hypothetical protein